MASGFTLLEAMLAIVILGTGVLSILAAQQAFHRENDWASHASTALMLANEIREMTLSLPLHDPITGAATLGPEPGENGVADYDDVDDFAGVVSVSGIGSGVTIDPPVNAMRQVIDDMTGWSQVVNVESVLPTDISAVTPQPLGSTDMMRVTVTVRYQSPQDASPQTMSQLTWIVGQ